MRIVEAIFAEELRDSFMKRNDKPSRVKFDSRHSEKMPPTFFELAAEKVNNRDWKPKSVSFPDYHEKLKHSYTLYPPDEEDRVDATSVKNFLTDCRAKMLKVSEIIKKKLSYESTDTHLFLGTLELE